MILSYLHHIYMILLYMRYMLNTALLAGAYLPLLAGAYKSYVSSFL